MNRLESKTGVLLGLLLSASVAFAGAQARIIGQVVDGNNVPLEGVKITITTPAISSFKIEQKTDKNGKWTLILNDATVKYNYKFEKDGYMPKEELKKIGIGSTEDYKVQLLDTAQAVAKGVVKEVVDPYVLAYNGTIEKLQAGDLDGAFLSAQEAIKLGPDKSGAWDLAARVAHKKKDWDKAIEWGEKSLQVDDDNDSLIPVLIDAHRAKGNKDKVALYEKKFAAANPTNPDILYNQAVPLFNAGKFKEAQPLLEKAVEAKPDYANAHFLLGMSYVNLNNIPEMKTHLKEYLRLEPKGKEAAAAKEMLEAFK